MKKLKLIYEDNHQLVVDKPAGLLTQPSGTEQESLEAWAKGWIKEKYGKPGEVYLHAVHRLDKPVSGIVLFARTSKALSRLQEFMRSKRVRKIYVALVEGSFEEKEGILEHYLVHEGHYGRVADENEKEAKKARLLYRILKTKENRSLVEVELDTGRYHQIRVQLAAIGHPIVGDKRYGSSQEYREGEIALHHSILEIPHPITGVMQTFVSDPPQWI